ncbi:hypothetical protein LTR37_001487 [Vermiconidia calcicola]|uniref:Uncharacterized protein n=1 Tax=Vermiconidia calcicola TaxID=1690605 RepID=A0ACC3NVM7_9PEZI|nr:hypothetical protein LTR37_001487 [Vermiconidia calcicola]
MTDHTTTPFRLTALPAELRNWIYQLVLPSGEFIALYEDDDSKEPALSRTCSQIRNETLPMWYAINAFAFKTNNSSVRSDNEDPAYTRSAVLIFFEVDGRDVNMHVESPLKWLGYEDAEVKLPAYEKMVDTKAQNWIGLLEELLERELLERGRWISWV